MDITQTIAPTPSKPSTAAKAQLAAPAEVVKEGGEGLTTAADFSRLLQDEAAALAASNDVPYVLVEQVATAQAGSEGALHQAALEDQPLAFSLESLVGQTQRLDASDVDAELQNGSLPRGTQVPGWVAQSAQTGVAIGQRVATVAAGVQSAVDTSLLPATSTALAAATAVIAEAAGIAEAAVQEFSGGMKSDAGNEGRMALLGSWQLAEADTEPSPALQRLMGQVEQWAAATAGVQPKPLERLESSKSAANSAEWLSGSQGSGTRLTDAAVQEAQAAQDALLDTQPEAPVEDLRFWLQGKQQRAEVVLEKDGQPVRVQVSVRGNEAHVTFRADEAQTRELLDASLAQLRDMLEQQGVQLAGVSVQADAQSQASPDNSQRNPWEAAPVQHAQVVVPVADAPAVRVPRAQGIDLYA